MGRKILLLEAVGPSVTTNTPLAFDPAFVATTMTLATGNFKVSANATGNGNTRLSVVQVGGLAYVEFIINSVATTPAIYVGLSASTEPKTNYIGQTLNSVGYKNSGSTFQNNVAVGTYASFTAGDVIGMAIDLNNGKVYFAKNGIYQGGSNPNTGASPAFGVCQDRYIALFHATDSRLAQFLTPLRLSPIRGNSSMRALSDTRPAVTRARQ